MSTNTSDAERLLNQIVAARVRLSGLRGESTPSVARSTREEDAFPGSAAPNPTDWMDIESQPATNATPQNPPLSEPAEPLPELHSDFDRQLDFVPDSPPYDSAGVDFLDTPHLEEDTETLVLGIDPEGEGEAFEDMSTPPPRSHTPIEDDPFSFIDLIPPRDDDSSDEVLHEATPSEEPPPIRPKPTMPLPTAIAAGAPKADLSTGLKQSPDSPSLNPVHNPQPSYGLHQPRPVTPRIVDPDRSVLEVDVYEDEAHEHLSAEPVASAPRLTEDTSSDQRIRSRTSQLTRSEDDLFDTISAASTHLRHGNIKGAKVLFDDVLDWIPDHLEARIARGKCNRDLGDTVAAISDFIKAQQAQPHSPIPTIELGNLFFAKKDYIRAIGYYDAAIEIDPNDAMTLCRRGICFHHRKRPDRALEDLQLAQKINPNIPNIGRYVRMVQTRT